MHTYDSICDIDYKGKSFFFWTLSISFGPGHFRWTLLQFFWRWPPFFWTCAPSCWTSPFPPAGPGPFPNHTHFGQIQSFCPAASWSQFFKQQGARSCASMQRGMLSLLDPRGCGAEMEERRGSTWCRPGSWGHLATVLLAYWVSRLRSTTISCIHLVSIRFHVWFPSLSPISCMHLASISKVPPHLCFSTTSCTHAVICGVNI